MTVLIGMFLLGLFIALGTWTVSWSNHVKSELVVKVYFKDSATTQQRNDYARMLQQSPYVKAGGIKYVSKAQAFREMKKRYPELGQERDVEPASELARGDPEQGRERRQALRTR